MRLDLLEDILRRADQRQAFEGMLMESLPALGLRRRLRALLVAGELEVTKLPSQILRFEAPQAPPKMVPVKAMVLAPEESQKHMPSFATQLRFSIDDAQRLDDIPICFVAVQRQKAVLENAMAEVCDELDVPGVGWQIDGLLEAARQGTLDSWGTGSGSFGG